jgi:hypothetical protein
MIFIDVCRLLASLEVYTSKQTKQTKLTTIPRKQHNSMQFDLDNVWSFTACGVRVTSHRTSKGDGRAGPQIRHQV